MDHTNFPETTTDLSDADDDPTENVRVVTIGLCDEHGIEHDVRIEEDDLARACGLTPDWIVSTVFEKPEVISKASCVCNHPQRRWRDLSLSLARFIMDPPRGHTVRNLDGDKLNLTRPNMVVLPKGARLNPKPQRPPTAKELEKEAAFFARCDAQVFKDHARTLLAEAAELRREVVVPDAPTVTTAADAQVPAVPPKRKRVRRPGAKRAAALAATQEAS